MAFQPLKLRIVALVLVLAASLNIPSASGQILLTPSKPFPGFPRTFFGMHVHLNPGQPKYWPIPQIGALRLWDSRVGWAQLEPSRGKWSFERLDEYVDWAIKNGVDILLPLGITPQWASARPGEPSAYSNGNAAEPHDLGDWRQYVRTVGLRYKGRINNFEIWNEVSVKAFFSGERETLAELARTASEELRAINPESKLVAPSAVSLGAKQVAWPAEFMQLVGGKTVDVASFHLYHAGHPPESMLEMAPKIRQSLNQAGFSATPLWNTEMGYFMPTNVPDRGNIDKRYNIDPLLVAQYLPRDMLLARAMGFERFYWYSWDNDFLGFLEPRTGVHRPHARVLAQFISLFTDSSLSSCGRDERSLWTCALLMKSGVEAQAVWVDNTGSGPVSVPRPFSGTLHRLDGRSTGAALPETITVDGVVQLLIKAQSK